MADSFNFSDYLEGQIYDHLLRTASWSKAANLYVGLTSGAPISSNTGSNAPEFAFAAGYARVNYGPPANSGWQAKPADTGGANTLVIQFPTCVTTGWGLVSGIIICDAATAGNVLMFGNLTTPRTVAVGDAPFFSSGNLSINID